MFDGLRGLRKKREMERLKLEAEREEKNPAVRKQRLDSIKCKEGQSPATMDPCGVPHNFQRDTKR